MIGFCHNMEHLDEDSLCDDCGKTPSYIGENENFLQRQFDVGLQLRALLWTEENMLARLGAML